MSKFMRPGECALDRCLKVAILCANRRLIMRSTIDIDIDLLEEARALTGARTKKEVIHISLRELVGKKRREHLAGLFGSSLLDIGPDELDKMREDEV
jgi:Arc/MetJ family transcription regulator